MLVIHSCPLQLANDMSAMSAKDRCVFVLNVFCSPFTHEWNSTYCNVAMFIFNMLNMDYNTILMHFSLMDASPLVLIINIIAHEMCLIQIGLVFLTMLLIIVTIDRNGVW